ncbi:hypothetical protein RG565_03260 [Streptococcus sp. IsoGale021]|uniref:hypothetical protein n=1 Tax=Streptococcus TaxID=1301 RepID=UPI002001ABE8|nr:MULTISPECIES: hypothetical protein [Streptococcus]MCY7210320.1 hypothetical protein [Streptococcus anginosus]MCY7211253.1 hypothetical protein [Streptococcus anginosus]MCY7227446.1 hypothetical protein [Streptococcus anginosus]MCY7232582.1 hypothetical protein [Streptococcus anginosus]MDQ8694356.1 hypothetical protein [Streptococcus sp. IsoGale021]
MIENLDVKEEIIYAISRYDYAHAYKLTKRLDNVEAKLVELLYIMAERRELNIRPAMEYQLKIRNDFQLFCHESEEDEQLANYLYDLEAKLKNEQVIDFIRAVSPAIYRIFMRLIKLEIPDIESYIHNSREASYDRWNFEKMKNTDHPILSTFHAESPVHSSSLASLILLLDLPEQVKIMVKELRKLEKSVRNPLAHLIKHFDEEELHSTTGFSSQFFMEILILLAKATGITYDEEQFFFDQVNQVIKTLID